MNVFLAEMGSPYRIPADAEALARDLVPLRQAVVARISEQPTRRVHLRTQYLALKTYLQAHFNDDPPPPPGAPKLARPPDNSSDNFNWMI